MQFSMDRHSCIRASLALALIGSLASTATAQQGGTLTTQQITEILSAHNRYRREVGVADLTWSKEMAQLGQDWVQQGLATLGCNKIRDLDHRPNNQAGENIAYKGASPKLNLSLKAMVDGWGDEKSNYDPATGECQGGVCGHYTQMVWANTREVGCGLAYCTDTTDDDEWQRASLVCNYTPAGNSGGLAYPQWQQRSEQAKDIGIGPEGSVWNGSGWTKIAGRTAVAISVAPTGWPWVVNSANTTFEYSLKKTADL